jgi:hypothetical protein
LPLDKSYTFYFLLSTNVWFDKPGFARYFDVGGIKTFTTKIKNGKGDYNEEVNN